MIVSLDTKRKNVREVLEVAVGKITKIVYKRGETKKSERKEVITSNVYIYN